LTTDAEVPELANMHPATSSDATDFRLRASQRDGPQLSGDLDVFAGGSLSVRADQ
jgi:hypothetical protein